ncbi:MAG: hypothetical protein IPK70_10010 [Flavobacteriales bacterium]|nr:hypothetical protein [Flavobacteriales bacterium]
MEHVAAAREKIAFLEWQRDNLPADKGPELKPAGGPVITLTRAEQKVEIEKKIADVKKDMLEKVAREMNAVPLTGRERSQRSVDKVLYGEQQPEDRKDIDRSQAFASQEREQSRSAGREEPVLEQGDRKTLDESQRYAYRQRYKDAPELEPVMEATEERDAGSPLDQSQQRAYQMRYRDRPVKAVDERGQRNVSKDAIEPDKE